MSSSRDDILSRVRAAAATPPGVSRAADYAAIPRAYRRSGALDAAARVDLFAERLKDYGAGVYRCGRGDLAQTIREALAARGKRRIVIPKDLPREWAPDGAEVLEDGDLPYDEIDRGDGVVTGCSAAIALTGTIVLRHRNAEGRRALTLIPDYHLCVVREDQIVETVPEAIRNIAEANVSLVTTISGPSATSDIEMTRIKGVHGPRTLDVILVAI